MIIAGGIIIGFFVAAGMLFYTGGRIFAVVADGPAAITIAILLTLVTLSALGSAVITGSEQMVTLAATGVGALAGAVTSVYTKNNRE